MAGNPLAHFGIKPRPWIRYGVCGTVDPDLWYPERPSFDEAISSGEPEEEYEGREIEGIKAAKKICGRCPVRLECLWDAIEHDERFGIWGGMSHREREKVRKEYRNPFRAPYQSNQKAG